MKHKKLLVCIILFLYHYIIIINIPLYRTTVSYQIKVSYVKNYIESFQKDNVQCNINIIGLKSLFSIYKKNQIQ